MQRKSHTEAKNRDKRMFFFSWTFPIATEKTPWSPGYSEKYSLKDTGLTCHGDSWHEVYQKASRVFSLTLQKDQGGLA